MSPNPRDFLRLKCLASIDKAGEVRIIVIRQYKTNDFVSQTDH